MAKFLVRIKIDENYDKDVEVISDVAENAITHVIKTVEGATFTNTKVIAVLKEK